MIQHPLFEKSLIDFKLDWVSRLANRFLSTGAACYYICEDDVRTRVYIYNYFGLMNGNPFRTRWTLRAYTTDGKNFKEISGIFKGTETVCVEMDSFAPSAMGVCLGRIDPEDNGRTIRKTFTSLFYTEYYTETASGFIHSLGFPVPKLYNANDYIFSSIHPGCDAQLVLSDSCQRTFHVPRILSEQGPAIEVENHRKEKRKVAVGPVAPLACRRVSLNALLPDLQTFSDGQPLLFRITGPNVLYSPLLMQKGQKGFLSVEHFQALDWDDLA